VAITGDEDGTAEDHHAKAMVHAPPPPPPIPQPALPEDVIDTAPQQTLTGVDRARMSADRAWTTIRKAVDIGAVKYVYTHTKETMRRRRDITRLQKEIVSEQQRLDAILGQLGRQARQADLGLPALADEMRATKSLEGDATAARGRISDYERRRHEQQEKFQSAERELQATVAHADEIALKLTEELAAKSSERAGHRAGMNRLEAQLKSLARHVETKKAELATIQDPNAAAAIRGEIDATNAQILVLEPEQKRFAQQAAALDAPIADLEQRTQAAKDDASRRRREMGDATRVHNEAVGQIQAQIEAEQQRINQSERELSLKFVTLGTILNLNRVPGSAFDQHYQEFDGIKGTIAEKEQQIALLEAEIKGVDRGRFNKGLIVMVSGVLLLALIIAIIVH
jgi:chromosome segregation ATPase